jgi:hypothetical protein
VTSFDNLLKWNTGYCRSKRGCFCFFHVCSSSQVETVSLSAHAEISVWLLLMRYSVHCVGVFFSCAGSSCVQYNRWNGTGGFCCRGLGW